MAAEVVSNSASAFLSLSLGWCGPDCLSLLNPCAFINHHHLYRESGWPTYESHFDDTSLPLHLWQSLLQTLFFQFQSLHLQLPVRLVAIFRA